MTINSTQWIIKKIYITIRVYSPRKINSLLLSSTEVYSLKNIQFDLSECEVLWNKKLFLLLPLAYLLKKSKTLPFHRFQYNRRQEEFLNHVLMHMLQSL